MSGTKGHSGRRRKATCSRNGRTYVALDMVNGVTVNHITFRHAVGLNRQMWSVDGMRFDDFTAAAAEFVRRVNG